MMLDNDNNLEIVVVVDCRENTVGEHVDVIGRIFDDYEIVPCRKDRDNSDRYLPSVEWILVRKESWAFPVLVQ